MIVLKIISFMPIFYLVSFVCGVQLPDVYWDPNEPMFNETLCDPLSKIIHVREDDSMSIICSNRDLNNAVDTSNKIRLKHYFNIYITDDKDLYRERKRKNLFGKATLLHRCMEEMSSPKNSGFERPLVSKRFLQFSPFGITANVKFKGGKKFYIFTTSDGTKESLNYLKAPEHTKHLGFEIHVCKSNKDCPYNLNRCLKKPYRKQEIKNDDPNNNADSELKWSNPALVATILIVFVGGIVIGGLLDHLHARKRNNRIEKQRSMESPAQSTELIEKKTNPVDV